MVRMIGYQSIAADHTDSCPESHCCLPCYLISHRDLPSCSDIPFSRSEDCSVVRLDVTLSIQQTPSEGDGDTRMAWWPPFHG